MIDTNKLKSVVTDFLNTIDEVKQEAEAAQQETKPDPCPICAGQGKIYNGVDNGDACDSCNGEGTLEEFKIMQSFNRGWNAALDHANRSRREVHRVPR